MKKILIIMGRYLPGYKDGGPVRSIKNLIDHLGEEYEFSILTCDRDHGDSKPYENIKVNDWNRVGNANVFYVPPKGFTLRIIHKLAESVDLVYVCGCFNDYAIHTLMLKRIHAIKKPVVVAAMGLFSPNEFKLKYWKKKIFVETFILFGMFKKIYWSATSETEAQDIQKRIRITRDRIFIAEDLPRKINDAVLQKDKEKGMLKLVWISRITPIKNLIGVIEVLKQVTADIEFTIYGPIQDQGYWELVQAELGKLPENIKYHYEGEVDSESVIEIFQKYHVFAFMTLSENYGHVIQEALSAGCLCIISNQTPWQNFQEEGIGYVYPLEAKECFVEAIETCAAMGQDEYEQCMNRALQYVAYKRDESIRNTGYRKIFEEI